MRNIKIKKQNFYHRSKLKDIMSCRAVNNTHFLGCNFHQVDFSWLTVTLSTVSSKKHLY